MLFKQVPLPLPSLSSSVIHFQTITTVSPSVSGKPEDIFVVAHSSQLFQSYSCFYGVLLFFGVLAFKDPTLRVPESSEVDDKRICSSRSKAMICQLQI